MASTPTELQLLELDVDLRVYGVLLQACEAGELDAHTAALIRLAYGAGYCDALNEPSPGELCLTHGFDIPKRDQPSD